MNTYLEKKNKNYQKIKDCVLKPTDIYAMIS